MSFSENQIETFNSKWIKGDDGPPSTCVHSRYEHKKGYFTNRCKADPNEGPVFTVHWRKNSTVSLPPRSRGPTVAQQQYAIDQGYSVLYSRRCDRCKEYNRHDSKKRKDARRAEVEAARERGVFMCRVCGKAGGKDKCGFTGTNTTCKICRKSDKDDKTQWISETQAVAPTGSSFCNVCRQYKPESEFVSTVQNKITGEIKEIGVTRYCQECSLKNRERMRKLDKQLQMEMRQEKMAALTVIQEKDGCKGCHSGCCVDLKAILKTMSEGEADLKDENDDNVVWSCFARLLEWDHLKKKVRAVSQIRNKAKRMIEIKKCQLLCMFCHRLKTYRKMEGAYKTRKEKKVHLTDYILFKQEYLNTPPKHNGSCPGTGDKPCNFSTAIKAIQQTDIRAMETPLQWNTLILLLYDFDHDDRSTKIGQVWIVFCRNADEGRQEAKKCTLRCCMCHAIKTVKNEEYGVPWLRTYKVDDKNEEDPNEEEPKEMDDMELRELTFQ